MTDATVEAAGERNGVAAARGARPVGRERRKKAGDATAGRDSTAGPASMDWFADAQRQLLSAIGLPDATAGTLFGVAQSLLHSVGAALTSGAAASAGKRARRSGTDAAATARSTSGTPASALPDDGQLPPLEQAYIAWSVALDDWLSNAGLDGMELARARFVARILKDVLAPHNSLVGNPAARQRARETKGESLRRGLRNLMDDLRHNHGYPAVANRHAFTLGVEVASTPGEVILRTELLELIQYRPVTPQVHAVPIVYVFSQVNRFYLGDLTADRSLFRALLDAGITVFAVSWRNPTPAQRNWGLDSYVDGVIRAIDAAKAITGSAQVSLVGVCAGGIATAVAAAVLRARGRSDVACLSQFINVLDNRLEDSEFGLWLTEASVAAQKREVRARGVFTEKQVFEMFAWLRPEENVMAFLRSNYLLGEEPPSHPLLFWSMDYTRMPARLHADHLELSLHNALARGELKSLGMHADLAGIDCPVYVMAGSTDHITPWPACYRSVPLFAGQCEFVLTSQNHTQTLCAREDNRHLRYWRNPALPTDPETWFADAQEVQGHWRTHWIAWLQSHSGALCDAPVHAGGAGHVPLCAAPGTYVLGR